MKADSFQHDVRLFERVRGELESELRARIPGVRAVGIGLRMRNGILTSDIAFRVYVDCKRPRIDLLARERVPRFIDGFPTDVHTILRTTAQCKNHTRPLVAGIPISSDASTVPGQTGTLGCFVRVPPDNHIGALTNEHVLRTASLDHTNTVYQPTPGGCNVIGSAKQNSGRQEIVDGVFVDCAVADLKSVSYTNRICKAAAIGSSGGTPVTLPSGVAGSVAVNASDQVTEIRDGSGKVIDTTLIVDSGPAVLNSLVFKVGGKTGLTVGYVSSLTATTGVTDIRGFPLDGTGQVEVTAIAGFKDSTGARFSDTGDSGSVYMDLNNRVVALHHHGGANKSFGAPIASVLSALHGITVDTESGSQTHDTAASNVLAQQLWADAPAWGEDPRDVEARVRRRLTESIRGRALVALVDKHFKEIMRLVWQRRPVTVAWHRHHGPAFVALFARALARHAPLPDEAGRIPRRAALVAMADILTTHGSAALRDAIAEARPWLLEPLARSRTLEELCDRLGEDVAAQ